MTPLTIKPLQDYVFLETIDDQVKATESGIVLIKAQEHTLKATVVGVGDPRKAKRGEAVIEPLVKLGDVVLINNDVGTPMKVEGRNCTLVRETDIIAIVE